MDAILQNKSVIEIQAPKVIVLKLDSELLPNIEILKRFKIPAENIENKNLVNGNYESPNSTLELDLDADEPMEISSFKLKKVKLKKVDDNGNHDQIRIVHVENPSAFWVQRLGFF